MSNLTNEQQRLINMYVNQYNTTNGHIDRLLDMLDEIRSNILNVIAVNQPRTTRMNRHSTNSNALINRFINQSLNDRQHNYIHYDYNNPINQNIYNENVNSSIGNTINGSNSSSSNIFGTNEVTNFLTNFLNTSVPVRPTRQQINNASITVRYDAIENPLSESCPISLERFTNHDIVRQLKPCGHIFSRTSFRRWFENNVRCPVCRYDIRNYRDSTSNISLPNVSNPNVSNPNVSNPNVSNPNVSNPSVSNPSVSNPNIVSQAGVIVEDINNSSEEEEQEQEQSNTNNVSINRNPVSNEIDNITFDITNHQTSSNIINSLTNRLLQSILSPQTTNPNNNNESIMFDPSNNILFYETILRPYASHQNNRQT